MKSKKRILVSVSNDLSTDQRVHKVCTYLHENNYEVILIGRKLSDSKPIERNYATKRMRLLFNRGALFYAELNLRLFFVLLFQRKTHLLSNDLDTLLANYLAFKFSRKTNLIYDTHEYFTEVPELQGRFAKKVWETIEKRIFPRLQKVYTVNDSIAKLYHKKYGNSIQVVRNISPKWKGENIPSKKDLGLPMDKDILILQGSGINIDRGAEEIVEAMKNLANCVLIFVGNGDVVPFLKKKVAQENLQEKVLFFGKRPYQELMYFTHHATIGLTLDKSNNLNYTYSLPNKVFDYIHTRTPILCTNLPEVVKIVKNNEVGVVLEELSPANISEKIATLLANKEQLKKYRENCKNVAEKLNWEQESKKLDAIYNDA